MKHIQTIRGIEYRRSFSNEYGGHACPQSINDQWFLGDAQSVRLLLESFPQLNVWHKSWEANPKFDKWWLHHNKVRDGHFFLNAEGIYGKMLQHLNVTCMDNLQKSLSFTNKKQCSGPKKKRPFVNEYLVWGSNPRPQD